MITENGGRDPRRQLASVSELLEHGEIVRLAGQWSRPLVLDAIRAALDGYRDRLRPGDAAPETDEIVSTVRRVLLDSQLDRLRPVVNATGIVLHTNLGRAVLARRTVQALGALDRCCNLQINLEDGSRGKRNYMTEQLLCRLTGAEAALIVNNNAAATMLILTALCKGKEVIVSRGQLIEIGGSFRLPDCVHQSGVVLVEVGTTNKTHLRDYEQALTDNTGAAMRVNPSNYRVVGFTEEVPVADLVTLKEKRPVPDAPGQFCGAPLVIDDLGCGALIDLRKFGLPYEPTVQESVQAGADIVCFSGDKLIGGPQAGIIVGRRDLIQKIKKHPLTRMLRVGKLTDLVLEHTLRLFLDPDTLIENHPTLRMIATPAGKLKTQAQRMKRRIDQQNSRLHVEVKESESEVGGGSLPITPLRTYVLALKSEIHSAEQLNALLRRNEPPIITRISHDEVLLDMRTLLDGDEAIIVQALKNMA